MWKYNLVEATENTRLGQGRKPHVSDYFVFIPEFIPAQNLTIHSIYSALSSEQN